MSPALPEQQIAFIGAGSMAEAIIRGMIQKEIAKPKNIFATNRSNKDQLEALTSRYGIRASSAPEVKSEAIQAADLVVVAMKPKDVQQAFAEFSSDLRPGQLLLSVVAGLSISTIESMIPAGVSVARTMPNTSSTIGMGATGICFSSTTTSAQQSVALAMLRAIGEVCPVPEDQMNIVTGISGSGPAYVYYFMEALIAAGIEGGLDPEMARDLTVQTVLGAAAMVKTTQEDPAVLRRKVTSPNGTTQAALEVFEKLQFSEAVHAGVRRCAERSAEIGEQITQDVMKSS